MNRLLAGLLSVFAVGCASAPKNAVRPAPYVDLARFMGDWFVIANIPYFAEKDCYNSLESYRLTPEGKVDTVFTARRGSFDGPLVKAGNVATIDDPGTNARWTANFLGGLVRVRLVVLHVAPDYRYAVLATPDGNLAWIFACTSTLSENDYRSAVVVLQQNGVAIEKLAKVPQNGSKP
jgi:apolipoprotein D and lipocalin family protein